MVGSSNFFRVPVNKELLTDTVSVNKEYLTGTVPVNKELMTGAPPFNNFYLKFNFSQFNLITTVSHGGHIPQERISFQANSYMTLSFIGPPLYACVLFCVLLSE